MNVIAPSPERMEPITQCAWHPNGGMWTVANDPATPAFGYFTACFKYMHALNEPNPRYLAMRDGDGNVPQVKCWLLYPSPSARIATLDTHEDLLRFGERYGWIKCTWKKYMAPVGLCASRPEIVNALNFPAIAKDYDAIHVTEGGVERLERSEAELGEYRLAFWEAECILWLSWCFEKVEELGPLSNYMPHKHGYPTDILARRIRTYNALGLKPLSIFG